MMSFENFEKGEHDILFGGAGRICFCNTKTQKVL